MRPETSLITDVSRLLISSNELKGRQFIGSNQIVFGTYQSDLTYDWGGTLTHATSSALKSRGILVTATAQNSDNLIADIAIVLSKSSSMSPEYTNKMFVQDTIAATNPLSLDYWVVPLPPSESTKKQWQIYLIGTSGQAAYVKVQIIANDDVILLVEQNI